MSLKAIFITLALSFAVLGSYTLLPEAQAGRGDDSGSAFIDQLMIEARIVSIELLTGQRIEGRIRANDGKTLLIDTGPQEILIYKHAIATLSEVDR
jgi:RNA chaperone Hfq